MSIQLNKKLVTAVFATFMLSACGGGGGGGDDVVQQDDDDTVVETKLTWDNSNWDETEWQ